MVGATLRRAAKRREQIGIGLMLYRFSQNRNDRKVHSRRTGLHKRTIEHSLSRIRTIRLNSGTLFTRFYASILVIGNNLKLLRRHMNNQNRGRRTVEYKRFYIVRLNVYHSSLDVSIFDNRNYNFQLGTYVYYRRTMGVKIGLQRRLLALLTYRDTNNYGLRLNFIHIRLIRLRDRQAVFISHRYLNNNLRNTSHTMLTLISLRGKTITIRILRLNKLSLMRLSNLYTVGVRVLINRGTYLTLKMGLFVNVYLRLNHWLGDRL